VCWLVYIQTMDTLEENGELVFLYQLIDGVTDNSHAVYTAQRAGVPQHILDRVAQVQPAFVDRLVCPFCQYPH